MAQAALERITALYGGAFSATEGVIHVAAVCRGHGDALDVLKIEPETPRSVADTFALSLSRARADAILTTGAIFRAEPALRVEPFGPLAPSLLALRKMWGRTRPPALLVLTRGDLDLAHPGLHTWIRPIVITNRAGAARLRPQVVGDSVHIVQLSVPSAAAAITWARENLGARTITVEAGPSTALSLYDSPSRVDELMLSVLQSDPPPQVRGRPFLSVSQLQAALGPVRADISVDETSGPWRIQRWIRSEPKRFLGTNRIPESSR